MNSFVSIHFNCSGQKKDHVEMKQKCGAEFKFRACEYAALNNMKMTLEHKDFNHVPQQTLSRWMKIYKARKPGEKFEIFYAKRGGMYYYYYYYYYYYS